jgi:uncharacterized protein YaaQ
MAKKDIEPIIAYDYFGTEIKLGATVAFMRTGYRNFMVGVVEKITEHLIFISHPPTNVCSKSTKQQHSQVFVKPT